VPPLQYVGSAALRQRFSHWFDGFEGSIGQEVHDLTIVTSGDVVASMLIRASGIRKNGHGVGFWVRATSSFQRSDNGWLITHEHVSLPVDLARGTAVTNLAP
jgi:ketosteroid isomerase-like protein